MADPISLQGQQVVGTLYEAVPDNADNKLEGAVIVSTILSETEDDSKGIVSEALEKKQVGEDEKKRQEAAAVSRRWRWAPEKAPTTSRFGKSPRRFLRVNIHLLGGCK